MHFKEHFLEIRLYMPPSVSIPSSSPLLSTHPSRSPPIQLYLQQRWSRLPHQNTLGKMECGSDDDAFGRRVFLCLQILKNFFWMKILRDNLRQPCFYNFW